MVQIIYLKTLFALFILTSSIKLNAEIHLPDIFSDHMVLQREMMIPVWGTSNANDYIEIIIDQTSVKTKADKNGNWKAELRPMDAGGPYELTIKDKNSQIQIVDIYVGEVWICSGQSNMEWPLEQSSEGKDETLQTNFPLIRLFQFKKKHDTYKTPYSETEMEEFSKGEFFHQPTWELSNPETAKSFSAVGYFFGKELFQTLQVPIGLIQAAVGGSPAQSWISKEGMEGHPQLQHLVDENKIWLSSEIIHPWLAERARENWGETEVNPLPGHPFAPTYLFDSVIKKIAPFCMRGVIWYQGESNATHPSSYTTMMEVLLKSWRGLWNQGDFPFYFVQLPRIGNRNLWPEFREAQQECLTFPNTGMVVTIDQGHHTNVHPKEKKVIGQRLAWLALAKTYSQNIESLSPQLVNYDWNKIDRKITLHFENGYDGLKVREGEEALLGLFLQGYVNQGTKEVIVAPDEVVISDNTILIYYDSDFLPIYIKYAWAPYPFNNLINSAGLPVAPFKIALEGVN